MLLPKHHLLTLLILMYLHNANMASSMRMLNAKGPDYQKSIVDCLYKISHRYFAPYRHLLTIILGGNVTSPTYEIQQQILQYINIESHWFLEILKTGIERVNFESGDVYLNSSSRDKKLAKKRNFVPEYKSKYVLIVTDCYQNFMEQLEHTTCSKTFDLRAKVLVYIPTVSETSEGIVNDVTEALLLRRIFQFLVVISKNNPPKLYAYSINLYTKAAVCGQNPKTELMYVCEQERLTTKRYFFEYVIPRNFQNCKIAAITVKYPPFVIAENRGFETQLVRELGKAMHINFSLFIDNETTSWGAKNPETNAWTGRLGYVQNNSAIGFGSVQYSSEVVEDFDFTTGYFYEHIVWVVPTAPAFPEWQCLFQIFTYHVWIACALLYTVSSIALYFTASRNRNEAAAYKNAFRITTVAWQIFIGNPARVHPLSTPTRAVFCSVVVANLIMAAIYQGSLIYPLTHTIYHKQIATLQDVLDSDLSIGGLKAYREFFNLTNDETSIRIFRMYKNEPGIDTAHFWLKTVNDKDIATLLGEFYVKYLVANATANEYSNVFISKENLMFYPVHIILPKGFPLRDRIDTLINRMIQGGLVDKWMTSYTEKLKEFDTLAKFTSEYHYNMPISIEKIQGAFVLLMIGFFAASVVFVLELFLHGIMMRKSSKGGKK